MKQLITAVVIVAAICCTDLQGTATGTSTGDTVTWRLVLIQIDQSSKDGMNKLTADYSDKETVLALRFISKEQMILIIGTAMRDTISYKRSRDTLMIYNKKLDGRKGSDTLLVKKQTADSLVLYRRNHQGVAFFRFSSKPYIKYRPQVASDFFSSAAPWKLIRYRSEWRSQDGKSSSSTEENVEKDKDRKTETFLYLANDTLAATISTSMNRSDTVFFRRRRDTLYATGSKPGILVMKSQSKDSLTIVKQEKENGETTTHTYHYAQAGTRQ